MNAAEQPVVVDMKTCDTLNSPKKPFVLVLHRGEPILSSIRECMQKGNIPSASFLGIGAIEETVVSEYNLEKQEYFERSFPGIHELVSLNGTTSLNEKEQTVAHVHVVFTDANYRALGGHLVSANVGVVVELTIIPFPKAINRSYDPETGLELMDACRLK